MDIRQTQHQEEYFAYIVNTTLPGASGTVFTDNTIRIDTDANFKLQAVTFVATSPNILMKLQDGITGRYLTKNAVDLNAVGGRSLVAGTGTNSFMPFRWTKPYILRGGSNIICQLSDYSTASNTLYLAFHGSKQKPGVSPWEYKFRAALPMIYNFRKTIAANATGVGLIEIDLDSHFLVQSIVGFRTGAAYLTISDGKDKSWCNTSIHIDNLIGNGAFPNRLITPRFLQKGSVLSVQVQDLSGSSNTVEIDVVWTKLYV